MDRLALAILGLTGEIDMFQGQTKERIARFAEDFGKPHAEQEINGEIVGFWRIPGGILKCRSLAGRNKGMYDPFDSITITCSEIHAIERILKLIPTMPSPIESIEIE